MHPCLPLLLLGLIGPNPTPESLQRTVRHFDFEEAADQRLELPRGFDRVVPEGTRGPAVFGNARPASTSARTGSYAFQFKLDGHSMAARSRPGTIPVRPGTDLTISGWTRTDGLRQASVRLAAWLVDESGRRVGPINHSDMLSGNHDWTELNITVEGWNLHGVEVVTELQVLQPIDQPRTQVTIAPVADIDGHVYFDDITIVQRPSVRISDTDACGLHQWGTNPRLTLHLSDPVPEPVLWSFVLENAKGAVIRREAGRLPERNQHIDLELTCPTRGWYRATVSAMTPGGLEARDTLDFVILDDQKTRMHDKGMLHCAALPTDEDMRLATAIGVREISVPVIMPDGQSILDNEHVRNRLDLHLDRGGTLEFHLDRLPTKWHEPMALDEHQIADFIEQGDGTWGPFVDAIALRWGPAAATWRLGGDADAAAAQRLHDRLAPIVARPEVRSGTEEPMSLPDAISTGSPIQLQPPWSVDARGRTRPTRQFPAMHTLMHAYADRSFGGAIHIAPGTEGLLLTGHDGRTDALLVRRADGAADTNALAFGGQGRRIDLDGNAWQLHADDEIQGWSGADTPFIIEEVDGNMIRFQRDLLMQPDTLAARPRRHHHQLQVTNPWPVTLRGTLHFPTNQRMQIEPASIAIELQPGAQRSLDVDVIVTGPLTLGARAINTMFEMNAPEPMTLPMQCWLDVGLPGMGIDVTTNVESNGTLDVAIHVHNHSDSARRLDVRLVGDGLGTLPSERITVEAKALGGHRFLVHVDDPDLHGQLVHVQIAEADQAGRVIAAVRLPSPTAELVNAETADTH
ncbi:MAG: hypothetical protein P8L37_06715 [Phycisphaerales bacterium]|nr:hypothetical protein [Phycisphaerales bacterium]